MVSRLTAGASGLPFMPIRNYHGTDLPRVNPRIRPVACPFTGEALYAVPALNPMSPSFTRNAPTLPEDTQVWGLMGVQKGSRLRGCQG